MKKIVSMFLIFGLSASIAFPVNAMESVREKNSEFISDDIKTNSDTITQSSQSSTSSEIIPTSESAVQSVSPAERKRNILKNYLPDLSNLQEIGLGVKAKNSDGVEIEQRVRPDVHFRGEDGKEYLVFYNNHIEQLRSLLYKRLEKEINDHKFVLSYDKSALREKANTSTSKQNWRLPIQVLRLMGNWVGPQSWVFLPVNTARKVVSWTDSTVLNRAKLLATTCANLNNALDTFGSSIDSEKICAVVFDKDLNQFIKFRDTPNKHYELIEKGFYNIANSSLSDKDMVIAMNKCMGEFERRICPRASAEQTIDFCFALNRASYYLHMLERDRQNKDLETLEAMDKFRRKIDRMLLEYRFISESNASPILGIRIDCCKIIVETERTTMIFLDREETRKFKKSLNTALDNKATHITRQYSIDSFTGPELRQLVESLDPDSCQDLIDQIDHKLIDEEAKAEKSEDEGKTELMTAGLRVMQEGANIVLDMVSGGASKTLGKVVSDVNSCDSKIESQTEFTQDQIEEFVKVEEKLKSEEKIEQIDPIKHLLSGNFDNPQNITIDHLPENPSPAPETRVDTTGFEYAPVTIRTRRENMTPLGQALKSFNLSPEDMESVLKGFQCFIESKRIKRHADILRKRRDQIAVNKKYMTEFINMVKLYIRIARGNFDERENFEGILIEEIKNFELNCGSELLRVYIVREINRLEEGL